MKSKCKIIIAVTIFLSFIIGGVDATFAQSGLQMSVSGRVRDLNSHELIPGATITVFKLPADTLDDIFSGTSNESGFYKIRYLEAGDYRFLITIPFEGIVYVDGIEFGGSGRDFYKFKIEEGRNVNLNIFIGKDKSPDVSREDTFNGSVINFKLIYADYDKISGKTESKSRSYIQSPGCDETYNGLVIKSAGEIITVGDNEKIMGSSKMEAGFIFNLEVFDPYINCNKQDDRCDIKFFNPNKKGLFSGDIKIHSFNWVKSHFDPQNQIPVDRFKCMYNALIYHEETHRQLACSDIVKIEWDNFLSNLKKKFECKCEEKNFCIKVFVRYLEKFRKEVKEKILRTEIDAILAQRYYMRTNCNNINQN